MSEQVERRLAALMSADVVSFSRLMSEDDEHTVGTLQSRRKTVERIVKRFRGRVVDSPGDNMLIELPSAVGAVRCAVEIQEKLRSENQALDPGRQMQFRIGIHVGDVMVDERGSLYGDGVNIAARLESIASPGAICLSDFVYQQVRRRLDLPTRDLGKQELKNIPETVRAYEVGFEDEASSTSIARAAGDSEPAPPPRGEVSLAVLPFLNMSGDPTQDYFSDGLTTDIMEELIRLSGLFLASEWSSRAFQNSGIEPAEFARRLGVDHVLEGSVRKAGDRVRISARLVDVSSGRPRWVDRYDRKLDDLFAVQDDITERIVTALDVELVNGEGAIVTRQTLRDPHAREHIYRGFEIFNRMTKQDVADARRLFAKAIEIEPTSPLPYWFFAYSHFIDLEMGWSDSREESLELLAETAHEALEHGDASGASSMMIAHVHLMRREFDEALERCEIAVRQRPSCQGVWCNLSTIYSHTGMTDRAIEPAQLAVRLSPVTQTLYPAVLATAYYLNGEPEAALAETDRVLSLAPDSVQARLVAIASMVESGRLDAARERGTELIAKEPAFTLRRFAENQRFRDEAPLDRWVGALQKAGLPYDGAVQGWLGSRRRRAPMGRF